MQSMALSRSSCPELRADSALQALQVWGAGNVTAAAAGAPVVLLTRVASPAPGQKGGFPFLPSGADSCRSSQRSCQAGGHTWAKESAPVFLCQPENFTLRQSQPEGCQRNSVRSPWNGLEGAGGWMRCSAGRPAPGRASFEPLHGL